MPEVLPESLRIRRPPVSMAEREIDFLSPAPWISSLGIHLREELRCGSRAARAREGQCLPGRLVSSRWIAGLGPLCKNDTGGAEEDENGYALPGRDIAVGPDHVI